MRQEVIEDFDRIARRYDLLTGLNPGYGKHLRWSATRLHLGPGARILDLCCGTGRSTRALVEVYPDAREIVGLDASAGMLRQASERFAELAARRPAYQRVRWVEGDAMDPAAALGDATPFDGILMAYGIRNVPDPDACLARLRDLLVPGGRLVLHEYSVADSLWSKALWNTVAGGFIAPLGRLATGNARMWTYLRQSVNRFDGVCALEQRLVRAGFVEVATLPMDGWQRGIVHSFVARRPA
ncbi:MAG: class I SAM-dependent methyltransferase [Deltaproteobacteria bacterium]|nr:class I SAM-dependent methyltransferase [Deltaproteobacteria bacterium]